MNTPGNLLREARVSRGLSLLDVAAMTRIPKNMIENLENDSFDEYVADVFVRGHLRSYARELNLDTEIVIQSFEHFVQANLPAEPVEEARRFLPLRTKVPEPPQNHHAKETRPSITSSISMRAPSVAALTSSSQRFKPTHFVALGLILVGLFIMISFLSGSRATAQDPVMFPETHEQIWEVEQDIEQTRWLLEQPASSSDND